MEERKRKNGRRGQKEEGRLVVEELRKPSGATRTDRDAISRLRFGVIDGVYS